MSDIMTLEEVKIYRITHLRNLSHILKHGITHRRSPNANPNYVSIGDTRLINTRDKVQVYVNNEDISPSGALITLGDFIPFYFGIRMPMLYVIQRGGNFVEKPVPPKDIIYLTCRLIDIINSGILFYFSDGHATDAFTRFYDRSKIANIFNIIDFLAIRTTYWGGDENLDIKRKKQAEFLAGSDIAARYLWDFGCYDNNTRNYLLTLGILPERIKIVPDAYY
jgi:hypothetical protein